MAANSRLGFHVICDFDCKNDIGKQNSTDIINGKYKLPIDIPINNCKVLDIGGGYGSFSIWSLFSCGRFWKNQTIYIYEPNKETYEILENNIKHLNNTLKFDIKLFNYGVSVAGGEDHVENNGLDSYIAKPKKIVNVNTNNTNTKNVNSNIKNVENNVGNIEKFNMNKSKNILNEVNSLKNNKTTNSLKNNKNTTSLKNKKNDNAKIVEIKEDVDNTDNKKIDNKKIDNKKVDNKKIDNKKKEDMNLSKLLNKIDQNVKNAESVKDIKPNLESYNNTSSINTILCEDLPKCNVLKININNGNYEILKGIIANQKPRIIFVAYESNEERRLIDSVLKDYKLLEVKSELKQKQNKFFTTGILKYALL